MVRFRKIECRIWNDAKFRALSDDGKLVFLYLLTHPHLTALGAMRASEAGLAAELSWTLERFAEPFRDCCSKGLIQADLEACFVALPNFLKYNQPANPNVVRSIGPALELLPECDAKEQLLQRVTEHCRERGEQFLTVWQTVSEPFRQPFRQPSRNSMPNQEKEREKEKEQNSDSASAESEPPPAKTKSSRRRSVAASDVTLPDAWPDTPEVRAIVEKWLAYKREGRTSYKDASQVSSLLRSFSGPEEFSAAVDHSIAQNYKGCFPPKESKNGTTNRRHNSGSDSLDRSAGW